MAKDGPRNGHYWTSRELMLRRDDARWRLNVRATMLASLPGILAVPEGSGFALAAFLVGSLLQHVLINARRSFGRAVHTLPLVVQGLFAIGALFACVGNAWGLLVCSAWLGCLLLVHLLTRREYEVEREARLANQVTDTRIRE